MLVVSRNQTPANDDAGHRLRAVFYFYSGAFHLIQKQAQCRVVADFEGKVRQFLAQRLARIVTEACDFAAIAIFERQRL